MISTNQILSAYQIIRPHIRRTPIVEVDGADFGIETARLTLKLESLQHAGSFKARGAFTNLLTRSVPAVGVVAASGGKPWSRRGVRRHETPRAGKDISSRMSPRPRRFKQISAYGAQLLISGERYADALAASEAWVAQSGAMPIHAFDQEETLLGQVRFALELEEQASDITTLLVRSAAAPDCRHRGVVSRTHQSDRRRTRTRTHPHSRTRGRPAGGRRAGGIAADSLAPRRVGELVFPIVQRH